MTAFYTFRMVGMVFFGNKSKHLIAIEQQHSSQIPHSNPPSNISHKNDDIEKGPKHNIHKVSPVMWIPFAILAIATIIIGFFEAELHSIMSS